MKIFRNKCGRITLAGLCFCAVCVGLGPTGEVQLPAHAVGTIVAGPTGSASLSAGYVSLTHDQTIGVPRSGVLPDRKPERALGPTGASGAGRGGLGATWPTGPTGAS